MKFACFDLRFVHVHGDEWGAIVHNDHFARIYFLGTLKFQSGGNMLFHLHRLPAVVHLLVAGISLFVIASMNASNVICSVISKAMKTPDIHNTDQKLNRMREGIRVSMIVAGVVTAIICSLALLYEAQPMESYGRVNGLIESSKIVAIDFSIEVAGREVVSAIWPM